MEHLHNGFTLELCPGAFPLSTDSIALAGFAKLPRSASVLDLGSGCGTLGLLLCANDSTCQVTGVELNEAAHSCALSNITANGLTSRLTSLCRDIKDIPAFLQPGSFHCCISNPPYFASGPASTSVPLARREDCCDLNTLIRSAAWALRYGGDFFLVHRPERLAEIFACAHQMHLEPKRLQLLHHKIGGAITLVLVQLRKGAKPGLLWEELYLYDEKGEPTQSYRELYHL